MFKAANPYDDIVTKATAETLTSENWELNLNVCDKVSGEGETGARNCIAAIQKRIIHRNANVQLYSLTLCDALTKNCGVEAHRELASRTFTQTLQRVVTDRNTHETVRKKTLELIKEWAKDFSSDDSLGMVAETMDALKAQGYKFEDASQQQDGPPAEPSSELLRKEDEELRRVLELSMKDVGGRNSYVGEDVSGSCNAAASSSAGGTQPNADGRVQAGSAATALVEKSLPDPQAGNPSDSRHSQASASVSQAQQPAAPSPTPSGPLAPSRVRALYDFTPSEVGELAFSKGDIIRVLDSVYEHWWRGELRGEAGIFPVNYVEILPSPTPAEIQREAEQEAKIFAQAHDIDRLLGRLRSLDPTRENLADDEELQDLYQSSLAMRPKIVRLIDRYSSKVEELRSMNEKFVKARSVFDGMMERSLAQHQYRGAAPGAPPASAGYAGPRPEYQGGGAVPSQQGGWEAQPQVQHYLLPQQQQPQHIASQPPASATTPAPPQSDGRGSLSQHDPQAYAQWYAQQQQAPVAQPGHPGYSAQAQQPSYVSQPQQGYSAPPQQTYPSQPQHGHSAQPQQRQPSYQQHPSQPSQAYDPSAPSSHQPTYGSAPQQAGLGGGSTSSSSSSAPQQQPMVNGGGGGGSSASGGNSSSGGGYAGPPVPVIVQEDEKKRLYEQARREAEAYHAAYGPGGGTSGQ